MIFPYQLLFQRHVSSYTAIAFPILITVTVYSNSGIWQTNIHFHFTLLCHIEGSSLLFNRAPGFCTSDGSFYFRHCHHLSLQVKPPLVDCAFASSLFCSLPQRWGRRYSSVREREMRGPFLISFLFSSFLLLFSSSLRIFWKASAVWSTWSSSEVPTVIKAMWLMMFS